ncbi:MAG: peptide chain release factor 2 [Vicinamibacterales bacterium]
MDELVRRSGDLLKRANDLRSYLDRATATDELATLEARIADPGFWNNPQDAQKALQRRRRLADDVDLRDSLTRRVDDLGVLLEWAGGGEDVGADLARGLDELEDQVEAAETKKMLSGEHDGAAAIVTIHPGAGGVDSQDWAEMLLRMYLKWAEKRGFRRELIDYQPGEEAGLKSTTLLLEGDNAFGLMSAEAGVHRLVRISPFDQQARRHTAFASVYVWPEIEDDVEIDIPEKDLRIDTYRSSGAGGQHVNVTDSAVRITHLPTGIVVSCQNERSQHKNRDVAMKVLRARLYDAKLKEQQAKLDQIGGTKKEIAFGSQIRSYVLQPYQMVKDHRTKLQVGDVHRVLDGDLDAFIKSYLMAKAGGTLGQTSPDDEDA